MNKQESPTVEQKDYIQYPVIKHNRREYKKEMCVYVYMCVYIYIYKTESLLVQQKLTL